MRSIPKQPAPFEADSSERVPLVDDRSPEPVDPAFREEILQGLEDVRRGDIANDSEIEAIFTRYRR